MTNESPVALAIDIGGTKVDAALVDSDGALVESSRARRATGRNATRDALAAAITDAANAALDSRPGVPLLGVGIGSAGPIDATAGCASPLNLPSGQRLEVVAIAGAVLPDHPIRLALDGACLLMAERWLGAARTVSNALAMVVSTGVGGGLMLDGSVIAGSTGNAGHIGQMRIREPGDSLLDGTLEAIASGPASVAWAREHGWSGSTGLDLAADYAQGQPLAVQAVRRSAFAVGEGIASAAALLDLEVAILAGGFVNVAADYVDLVRESVRLHAPLPHSAKVRVLRSPLGDDSPLVGAASLIHRSDTAHFVG